MQTNSPALAEGEIHIATIQITGEAPYMLTLLPGEAESVAHEEAETWAASVGGELPNRHEQALLFAHQREQFKRDWYWSSQPGESAPDYVWAQHFDYGGQSLTHRSIKLRARAVRRLIIQ